MSFIDQLFTSAASVVAFGFVIALLGYMYKRDACHWRYLATTYGQPWKKPIRERWGNLVLYGKFPVSKSYNGIAKIGVHHDGIALKVMMPPQNIFCRPLFIPFKDIRGWNQSWYLNAESTELELNQAREVKIVMPRDQLNWIRSMGGHEIEIMNQSSPNADKPVLWHAYLVFSSVIMIGAAAYVLLSGSLS